VGAVGAWAPNLADGRWRYGGSPGVIFETIYGGRANGMPAFGGVLLEPSIWKIVTYLQSLQPAEDQPTVSF
jgi:cytochrome c oxidase cbb3-type subunit 3